MRSYSKTIIRTIFLICGISLFFTACTQTDDNLGANMIPGGDDQMSIHIDTLGLANGEIIKASQIFYDSIGRTTSTDKMRGAMNLNINYIGKSTDPTFGKLTTASVFTGVPATAISPNFQKNRRDRIDSVSLTLNMKYLSGNADVVQTFNIYRLKDTLAYSTDTIYYQSFRYEDHIEAEPAFSFKLSGKPEDLTVVKLDIHDNGRKMLDELMSVDTMLISSSSEAYNFLRKFNGFVLAPASDSPEDAAIYANYLPNSYMNLYYQRERDQWEINYDQDNKDKVVTAYIQLFLSDANQMKNTSVASIRHDYSGTEYAALNSCETIAAPQKAYIQGLGGMATVLEFPETFFDAMSSLVPSDDFALFINQAHMYVWAEEDTAEAFDTYFQTLGSYIDYGEMNPISDYYISDSGTSSDMIIPYDGSLNRNPGKGYYKMDITSFLQHAYEDPTEENRRLTLAPTYDPYDPFAEMTSVIQTEESANPIRVRLTYTLVELNE